MQTFRHCLSRFIIAKLRYKVTSVSQERTTCPFYKFMLSTRGVVALELIIDVITSSCSCRVTSNCASCTITRQTCTCTYIILSHLWHLHRDRNDRSSLTGDRETIRSTRDLLFTVIASRPPRPSSASRSHAFDSCPTTSRRSHNRRDPRRSHMAVTTRTHYGDHNCRHRVPSNSRRKTDVGSRRMDYHRAVPDCRNNSARNRTVRTCPGNYCLL